MWFFIGAFTFSSIYQAICCASAEGRISDLEGQVEYGIREVNDLRDKNYLLSNRVRTLEEHQRVTAAT